MLGKFNELPSTVADRLSNHSLAAAPVVPAHTLVRGQGASLSRPVSIDGCLCQFQAQEEEPVP